LRESPTVLSLLPPDLRTAPGLCSVRVVTLISLQRIAWFKRLSSLFRCICVRVSILVCVFISYISILRVELKRLMLYVNSWCFEFSLSYSGSTTQPTVAVASRFQYFLLRQFLVFIQFFISLFYLFIYVLFVYLFIHFDKLIIMMSVKLINLLLLAMVILRRY
jgi:hypothetical protein